MIEHTVFDSWTTLALAGVVLFFAEVIYVSLGFGAGLIAVGTLAFVLPVRDVVVLLLCVTLPAELWVLYRHRHDLGLKRLSFVAGGLVVGIPVGTYVLSTSASTDLLLALGLFLIAAGAALFVLPAGKRSPHPLLGSAVGGLSGVLGAIFGTGGPPLVVYFQWAGFDKAAFRTSLLSMFFLGTILRFPTYAVSGLLNSERIFSAVVVAPVVVAGAMVGNALHLDVPERIFRRIVCAVLMLIGVSLVGRYA